MTALVVFDDGRGELGPLTDLRASFEVRTGALTTLERIERASGTRAALLLAPAPIAAILRERHACAVNAWDGVKGQEFLAVNGRCALPPAEVGALKPGGALVDSTTGELVAVRGTRRQCEAALTEGLAGADVHMHQVDGAAMLRRPWDVIRFRDEALRRDLAMLCIDRWAGTPGALVIGEHPVSVDAKARVYPGVIFDAEKGAIRIEAGAVVRPGAIVCGPCWIGPGSSVLDHALIKANTAIGPMCKAAGEVGGTIFQGWSNKGHDGHLGDAWVGEWANLGAGTTNSNLLNTYGEVVSRAAPGMSNERTGLTFLGCIVGDHAKFAIGTRIMTGAVIGTGTMWAASAALTGTSSAFLWSTDAGNKLFRFDKFLETARAMMARRNVAPSEAYTARLRELHHAAGAGS